MSSDVSISEQIETVKGVIDGMTIVPGTMMSTTLSNLRAVVATLQKVQAGESRCGFVWTAPPGRAIIAPAGIVVELSWPDGTIITKHRTMPGTIQGYVVEMS